MILARLSFLLFFRIQAASPPQVCLLAPNRNDSLASYGIEEHTSDFASSDHGKASPEPPTFGYFTLLLHARSKGLPNTTALISLFETQQVL
jgi:hypothetical protein